MFPGKTYIIHVSQFNKIRFTDLIRNTFKNDTNKKKIHH